MARATTQQDKRSQSKGKNNTAPNRNTQSTRASATDRQAPIQTARDENRVSPQNQQSQAAEHSQQRGQNQQAKPDIATRGMTGPIRAAMTSPLTLMQRMSEDMDRLFEQFGFGRSGFGVAPMISSLLGSDVAGRSQRPDLGGGLWVPQVETMRRGDRFVVRADLPGVDKNDVRVEIDNDILTISGERHGEQSEEREGFFRTERSYGSFYRAIPLPEGVNAEQSEARFNDGVLEISLPAPKAEQRKTKQIQIH